ncbi:MAG: hypothetical protein AAB676_20965 [Verrucomicrobiota bacterium]
MLTDAKQAILSFIEKHTMETYAGPAEDVIRAAKELGLGEAAAEEAQVELLIWGDDDVPKSTGRYATEVQVTGRDKNGREWWVEVSPDRN